MSSNNTLFNGSSVTKLVQGVGTMIDDKVGGQEMEPISQGYYQKITFSDARNMIEGDSPTVAGSIEANVDVGRLYIGNGSDEFELDIMTKSHTGTTTFYIAADGITYIPNGTAHNVNIGGDYAFNNIYSDNFQGNSYIIKYAPQNERPVIAGTIDAEDQSIIRIKPVPSYGTGDVRIDCASTNQATTNTTQSATYYFTPYGIDFFTNQGNEPYLGSSSDPIGSIYTKDITFVDSANDLIGGTIEANVDSGVIYITPHSETNNTSVRMDVYNKNASGTVTKGMSYIFGAEGIEASPDQANTSGAFLGSYSDPFNTIYASKVIIDSIATSDNDNVDMMNGLKAAFEIFQNFGPLTYNDTRYGPIGSHTVYHWNDLFWLANEQEFNDAGEDGKVIVNSYNPWACKLDTIPNEIYFRFADSRGLCMIPDDPLPKRIYSKDLHTYLDIIIISPETDCNMEVFGFETDMCIWRFERFNNNTCEITVTNTNSLTLYDKLSTMYNFCSLNTFSEINYLSSEIDKIKARLNM